MPAATRRDDPQKVSRQLDQVIAGNAFDRAAAAFADAAASARARRPDKARRLAAEADSHLATARRALNGLRYMPYVPPSRRATYGAGQVASADAAGEDGASSGRSRVPVGGRGGTAGTQLIVAAEMICPVVAGIGRAVPGGLATEQSGPGQAPEAAIIPWPTGPERARARRRRPARASRQGAAGLPVIPNGPARLSRNTPRRPRHASGRSRWLGAARVDLAGEVCGAVVPGHAGEVRDGLVEIADGLVQLAAGPTGAGGGGELADIVVPGRLEPPSSQNWREQGRRAGFRDVHRGGRRRRR